MNQFKTWIILVVLSIITKCSLGLTDLNKPASYCVLERVHKMVGYNCAKLELRTIPTYLKSSTEVRKVSLKACSMKTACKKFFNAPTHET